MEELILPQRELIGIMLARSRDLKGACHDNFTAIDDRTDEILASTRRWTHPVRHLSALLHTARRATRVLFCPSAAAGSNRPDDLWALQRILCRSDRKKTAEPLLARHLGTLLWNRGVQSLMQILPELGHEQVTGDGYSGG